jgi:hypothetical protein
LGMIERLGEERMDERGQEGWSWRNVLMFT